MKRSLAAASSGPSRPPDLATSDGSELVPLMVPAGGGDDESTSALPSTPSKALHDNNDANSDASTAARTVAVILDGMARAAILPFAPDLVGRVTSLPSLLDRNVAISAASGLGSVQGSDPGLWFALAASRSTHLVAVYALGRYFGTYLGALPRVRSAFHPSRCAGGGSNGRYFARAAGAAVALHLLTLGSGLQSLGAVRMVRFISAVLAGLLCKVTAPASAVGKMTVGGSASASSASEGDAGQRGDIKAATCDARGYLTGFALSSLASGLAQPILVRSHLYRILTGGRPFTLTPLFLLGVVAVVEIILGRLCAGCAGLGAGMPMFGGAGGGRGRGAAAAPVPQESSSRRRRSPTAILRSSLGGCRRRRRGGDRSSGAGEHVRWRRSPPSYNDFSSDGENDYAGAPGDTIALHEQNDFHVPRDVFHTPQQQFNRPRADSNHSAHSMHSARSDVFFDCASVNSDGIGIDEMLDDDGEVYDLEMGSAVPMEDLGEADVSNAAHDDRRYGAAQQLVTRYVDRRCVHPDDGSSPSYVPPHCAPDTVPSSYLQFCSSNLSKAQSMWRATQQWRRDQDVWKIHSLPHPHFSEIKAAYPHYIHGHSKKGYPIIYEHPGKMKLRGLFATGCTVDDMVHHYTYLMEYVANVLVEKEDIREARRRDGEEGLEPWGTMVVMDVSGASLSSLSGDVVRYLKRAGDTNSAHYPLTLKRAFVAHSPFWLSGAWSGIRGILPESVHVDLLSSSRQIAALREYIDDDQIPREYGGSSPYPLGEHPFELGLVRLVETQGRDASCSDGDNGASRTASMMESGTEGEATKSLPPPPAHVGLESAPDSAATSASTSFDEEDGFLEDVPFTPEQGESIAPESTVRSRTGPLSRRRSSNASVGDSDGATALSSTLPLHYDAGQRGTGWDENGPSFRAEEERVLNIASLMHMAWCAVHGLIESTLGPWMLCSPILGGLGYGPGRTGVTVFCACVVLMWMSRTVVARLAWRTPCRSPMRAYRIGVGSLAVLLVILPTIPTAVTDVPKKDSVVVLASTMILLSCVVVAAVMGRYAAVLIHGLATASYAEKQFGAEYARPPSCCAERLRDCCRKGQLSTTFLGVAGEISGAMLAGSLFGWSTNQRRPFPFDGACCFYVSALVCALLYILSYSLHLDSNGKFASHSRSSADGHRKGDKGKKGSRCALVGEVATVAVSDMASLFEESNWSSSTALGLSRGQPARSLSSLE